MRRASTPDRTRSFAVSAGGFDVLAQVAAAPLKRTALEQRVRSTALALLRRENLVQPAYSFCVVPLEAPPGRILCAGGERIEAPKLLPSSGMLTALACGVATIGAALEQRVSALFGERRALLAVALDSLGNELLLAVVRRAQDRVHTLLRRRGLTMAGELRAGDPGLALEAQPAVLRLAHARRAGVTLAHGSTMHPLKSASMVLGVGLDLPRARWSRCDTCPNLPRCRVARADLLL